MKRATLPIGVIILLSFLAVKAGAQLDSNAEVIIYCSPSMAQCHEMPIIQQPSGTLYGTENPTGWIAMDTSLGFAGKDSIHCSSSSIIFGTADGTTTADLFIDTVAKCFRNLTFFSTTPGYWQRPCLSYDRSHINFQISIDSLPYIDSIGIIYSSKTFTLSAVTFSAVYDCQDIHQEWIGSCDSDFIFRPPDTLSIKIIPNALARISSNTTKGASQILSILDPESSLVLCSLPFLQPTNNIEVFDLLGRVAAIIPIRIEDYGMSATTPGLPPGCYFARLGDQVAKFVVPPR